jgi:hypothetical protein
LLSYFTRPASIHYVGMIQRTVVLLLLLAVLLPSAFAAERKFTIKNSCNFTIWPAVSNFPRDGSSRFQGTAGWEAKPGSSQDLTMYAGRLLGVGVIRRYALN